MKRIAILLISLTAYTINLLAQQEATTPNGTKVVLWDDGTWQYADSVPMYQVKAGEHSQLELPRANSRDRIITHTGFALLYDEKHEQARWVAYELTSAETKRAFDRTDKFLPDPKVKSKTANDKDYAGNGYDRGHLAPAGDMGWSAQATYESFYYSNISPQNPGFNRGIWKRLETQVRNWAVENEAVYVVTGPILESGLSTIGSNKVSVPQYYYKVILDYRNPGVKAIGFIMRNASSGEPLQEFAVTVDSVEAVTGIDFFYQLSDDQEKMIEQTLCVKCWSWSSKGEQSNRDTQKQSLANQCAGVTRSGNRCKNKTTSESGYCYLHSESNSGNSRSQQEQQRATTSVQCSGTTKAGNRCRRMTYNATGRCYQH
ncbi:MAG: DNA/RNA non-specific endonuclease [Bacteroidota bacterium]|jgi:endonuclease G